MLVRNNNGKKQYNAAKTYKFNLKWGKKIMTKKKNHSNENENKIYT